ncbi:hypothetical protein [Campylobacter mucosalis]|uniref:Uncharacterized protein n=1 Tax=Campylobacter mucosalis CCUG 21559 TaxID=1032067 RepID=A0A6G5QGZ4_9BACT|nr:hypothetical protein [Campylobacter mucosalis]QCD44948.1 hypothetical protein CMUC_1174 [Campylobacter mucosalis CCUG 21559]
MKKILTKTRGLHTAGLSFDEITDFRVRTLTREQRIKEQRRFSDMKSRCYNPNDKDYKFYGGRGIKICDEWLKNSTAYYNFAFLNLSHLSGMTIDRIDPNGDYSPENCRFVPRVKNCSVNFISKNQMDAPNFREYRDFGQLYENQYEHKFFGDVSERFCGARRKSGWSVYESLKIPVGLSRANFWQMVRNGEIEFDNEIFLERTDFKAIYPNDETPIICPKCDNPTLYLNTVSAKMMVECEACGLMHIIQTV